MKIGISKSDITVFKKGVTMLGYGMPFNFVEEIETPLFGRAFIFKTKTDKVAFVNLELCFITQSLKDGVLQLLSKTQPDLNYTDANLILNAQHTHSATGGYSFYGMYNMVTPGFVSEIYESLVLKIVDVILKAEKNYSESDIYIGKSAFSPELEVGFQRSYNAYIKNPEAKKVSKNQLNLAIDREMTLLKFTNKKQELTGAINWFGSHTTNISNTNRKICSDNKGYAAQFLEDAIDGKFVGAFAQGTCGDVSPKYIFNAKQPAKRGKYEGKFQDDFESAKYNGKLQFEKATEILNEHANEKISSDKIDATIRYIDFGNVAINPKYCNNQKDQTTSPSCMGASFFYGTKTDGPGLPKPLFKLSKNASKVHKLLESFSKKKDVKQKYKAQGAKNIIIESGAKKILGEQNLSKIVIPSWADESIYALKHFYKNGALKTHTWTQQILPLQLTRIGNIVLATFPFEITTIAGLRLKKGLESTLLNEEIKHIILCPYSNSYSGYITTYEEYQEQKYEGGHTVFGKWSLAALQTEFEKLALDFLLSIEDRKLDYSLRPDIFTEADLKKFEYYESKTYKKFKG